MIRRGNRNRRSTAVAATASGGETMAPSAKQTAQGAPGTSHLSASPTASVVVATRPIASSRIGRSFARKSRHDVSIAAGYSTAGRTIASTRSGSTSSAGQSNAKPRPMPASTSTIGYGTWMRFASQPAAIAQTITRIREIIVYFSFSLVPNGCADASSYATLSNITRVPNPSLRPIAIDLVRARYFRPRPQ